MRFNRNTLKTVQATIDELEERLKSGNTKDWRFHNGKPVSFERPLNDLEKSKIKDTILKYRQELNKMIGAYEKHNEQKNKPTAIMFKKYSDK